MKVEIQTDTTWYRDSGCVRQSERTASVTIDWSSAAVGQAGINVAFLTTVRAAGLARALWYGYLSSWFHYLDEGKPDRTDRFYLQLLLREEAEDIYRQEHLAADYIAEEEVPQIIHTLVGGITAVLGIVNPILQEELEVVLLPEKEETAWDYEHAQLNHDPADYPEYPGESWIEVDDPQKLVQLLEVIQMIR